MALLALSTASRCPRKTKLETEKPAPAEEHRDWSTDAFARQANTRELESSRTK